jgi:muramidase (phage lysozyme)
MYPQSQNIHPGAENPNLYQTTRLDSDAYGRFQMLSTTWGEWASKAGVPTAKPGTYTIKEGTFAYYNMAPQYQDAAVANFLKSKGITDCQKLLASSNARDTGGACQWASIAGCSQENGKTRQYPLNSTCAKMLEDEKTGACKQ